MSYVVYANIPCECPNCGAKVSDDMADMKILYRNQHAAAVRIYCNQQGCRQWTDRFSSRLWGLRHKVVRLPSTRLPDTRERMIA